jgi:hypothetical protein
MKKTQVKSILKQDMQSLTSIVLNLNLAKWERARILYNMKQKITWSTTDYKTFSNYCDEELPELNTGSGIVWAGQYKQMVDFGYTWSNITRLSGLVSYSIVTRYLPTMTKKESITILVRESKAYSATRKNKVNKLTNPNAVSMHLSDKYIKKLTALLQPYGYKPSKNGRKTGISETFAQYLDTV